MYRTESEGGERVRHNAGARARFRAPHRHVDLQIGIFQPRIGADEGTGIDPRARQRTGAGKSVTNTRENLARGAVPDVVQGNGLIYPI